MSSELAALQARRWTRVGTLAALAMLMGYLESFVPIPIPGVKLGLANVAVLAALACHDIPGACWVAVVKVLATSLLFGNPVTLAYSAMGTLLALVLMAPLSQLPTMRLEMVSIVGALAHETGQLFVAQLLLGTPLVWYSAPVLAAAGCITGLLCGIVAQQLTPLVEAADLDGRPNVAGEPPEKTGTASPSDDRKVVALLAAFAALVVCAMHATSWRMLGVCLFASTVACMAAHSSPRTLLRSLAPTIPIALITLVAQIARMREGTVLLQLGRVGVTIEALAQTSVMIGRLVCVTAASAALVGLAGRQGLAHCARRLLQPLNRLGLDTSGPELALSTTLQLLPALATALDGQVQPHDMVTRAFWHKRLPQLLADLLGEVTTLE